MEALKIRTVDRLIALICERNVYRVLMESCQDKCVEFLAFCLIGGYKNIRDRLVDIRLILKSELRCIVTVTGARIAAREDCGSYGVPQQILNTMSKLPAFILSR